MNEEKYTRDQPKKSTNTKRVEPENKTTEKRYGTKLKNETSAGESYRKKLRYEKKDNSLTLEEKKKLQKMKKQGTATRAKILEIMCDTVLYIGRLPSAIYDVPTRECINTTPMISGRRRKLIVLDSSSLLFIGQ